MLSSQLIASFTVLTPGYFRANFEGILLVLIAGVISSGAGLWVIPGDLERLQEILNSREGWLFTTPILLAVTDICLTLVGLRMRPGLVELNPLVASAIEAGATTLLPFTISYLLMSQGLGLLMLDLGQRLFVNSDTLAYLPFSVICGAASLGLFSNFALIVIPWAGSWNLLIGILGAASLSISILYSF